MGDTMKTWCPPPTTRPARWSFSYIEPSLRPLVGFLHDRRATPDPREGLPGWDGVALPGGGARRSRGPMALHEETEAARTRRRWRRFARCSNDGRFGPARGRPPAPVLRVGRRAGAPRRCGGHPHRDRLAPDVDPVGAPR